MADIRILPDILSNQIAAGEVVARPASVVKELVENSIDAGAQRIRVDIEDGGKRLIRVSDDGEGLSRDQALLAIERYATSKIFTREDLFSISTFGFRGEALPSIASVSRFCLVSRLHDKNTGTRIDISGGKLSSVSDAGAPPGTMVEVKNLFFNTPARRKFLKSRNTEGGHIADTLSGMALGSPHIGFTLSVDNRLAKNFPVNQDLVSRSRVVLGQDAGQSLYPIQGEQGGIKVAGTCTHPSVTRATAQRIYLFVNQRLVYDRGLVGAVFRGYKGRIMKGRFPMGTVYVTLPFDQVDVNVHPSKREIKFLDPGPVYDLVTSCVESAMTRAQKNVFHYTLSSPGRDTAPVALENEPVEGPPHSLSLTESRQMETRIFVPEEPVLEKKIDFSHRFSYPPAKVEQASLEWDQETRDKRQETRGESFEDRGRGRNGDLRQREKDIRVVGQVMNTYILAEREGCLIMVDQHAAHERIVYETLKKRHQTLDVQSQDLLVPEILELGHREADQLEQVLADLSALGLEIESFGGTSFAVRSVPALVEQKDIKKLILEIVDSLANGTPSVSGWLEECLISMSCHRAVRANKPMNAGEMAQLLTDLFACKNPFHCPHGRPTMISFDSHHMEKMFKRLV